MTSKWFWVFLVTCAFVVSVVAGMWFASERQTHEELEIVATQKGIPVDMYADIKRRLPRIESEGTLTSSEREAIQRFASSDSAAARNYAVAMMNFGLRDSSPAEVMRFAERFLEDESPKVRSTAYIVLYKRDPEGWEVYRSRMESDPDASVRSLVDLFEEDSLKRDDSEPVEP